MLKELLKDWRGEIEINDNRYTSVEACNFASNASTDELHIKLYSANKKAVQSEIQAHNDTVEYRITVKKYMTEKSSPGFDFMSKWNNDNPMPLRTMIGIVKKEIKGMVFMKLHGQAEVVVRCMRCGRQLTNPISQHYGIGPECMSKLGLVCAIDDVETIKKKLVEVVWEGWIIKSAITEKEEIAC